MTQQAFAYIRVSSKEQEQEGYSLPAQEKFLHNYARENDIEIVDQFIDVETAKQAGRKQFKAMVDKLQDTTVKIIICEKVDRLYRNLKDWVTLDDLEVDLVFAKEGSVINSQSTSSEKLIHGIKVLMAKNYVDNLSEEVKKGLLEKAKQGELPRKAPIGYYNKEGKIYVDEIRAPYIVQTFELYADGHSLSSVAQILYQNGFRSLSGCKVAKSKIHTMLTTPTYYGYFLFSDTLYKGIHEPIISKSLFDQVQARLESKKHTKANKHFFAYRGLLVCGECGCQITAERQKGHVYYRCTKKRSKCSQPYVREEKLTKDIASILHTIKFDDSMLDLMKEAVKESKQEEFDRREKMIRNLDARFRLMQSRISKLTDSFLDGHIPSDIYNQKLSSLTTEQAEIETVRSRESHSLRDQLELIEKLGTLVNSWGNKFESLQDETKQELMSFIGSNFVLKDKEIVSYLLKEPFNLLAKGGHSPKTLIKLGR